MLFYSVGAIVKVKGSNKSCFTLQNKYNLTKQANSSNKRVTMKTSVFENREREAAAHK